MTWWDTSTGSALYKVYEERERQEDLRREGKFPWSCAENINPDDNAPILQAEKLAVLAEEFGEVADIVCKLQANRAESKGLTLQDLRDELIQVAAVAVAWAESIVVE